MTREEDMSDDNGQEWVWYVGYLHGYGHVCFQKRQGPGIEIANVRRITNIDAKDTQPGKVEFNFNPHLYHATGLFPDELNVRAEAVVLFAEAPEKVVKVLEETWNPSAVKAATRQEINRLTKLGDKA